MITSHARTFEVRVNRSSTRFLWYLLAWVAISLVLIASSVWFWGAAEVRGNLGEVAFLTLVGAVWLALANAIFPWLGLSIHDDAWERKNPAAVAALGGALLSAAVIVAAGNLGEGPSYLENIFCAALGTGGLLLLWFLFELGSHVSISIAVERDFASGLRFGALLLSVGLILGRAEAGNWHSPEAAVNDFIRDGWVAAMVCLVAFVIELLLRPSRLRPFPSWSACGLVPALLYLAAAAAWLWHLGRWEGMPQ